MYRTRLVGTLRYGAIALFTAALCCLWTAPCRADIDFSFASDQTLYSALPGSKVPVRLYLRETVSGGDSSVLASESGLFSAGWKLVPQDPLPTQPASVVSFGDIVPDAQFSGGSIKNLDPLTLLVADGILAEPGPAGDIFPDGSRRVLLATFYFTAGSIVGETTSFKITDYDDFGISSDTLTWQGTELDKVIAPGVFAITTVIPEPSGLLLLPVAAVCLYRLRSRVRGRA